MLWDRRRRKGSEESCSSTLEPTVGLGQKMQDTLESLKEPLSPFQGERADVGSRGHRHQARSLRGPRRAPVPPSPSRASSSSPDPRRTRSEFFLTQWGKLFPGLLKLKGDSFRQPRLSLRAWDPPVLHKGWAAQSPIPLGCGLGGGIYLPHTSDLRR